MFWILRCLPMCTHQFPSKKRQVWWHNIGEFSISSWIKHHSAYLSKAPRASMIKGAKGANSHCHQVFHLSPVTFLQLRRLHILFAVNLKHTWATDKADSLSWKQRSLWSELQSWFCTTEHWHCTISLPGPWRAGLNVAAQSIQCCVLAVGLYQCSY